MKVDTIPDLSALLQALREHGVTSFETADLKLCLGQPRTSTADVIKDAEEDWEAIAKRLEERAREEDDALALAHVSRGRPTGEA